MSLIFLILAPDEPQFSLILRLFGEPPQRTMEFCSITLLKKVLKRVLVLKNSLPYIFNIHFLVFSALLENGRFLTVASHMAREFIRHKKTVFVLLIGRIFRNCLNSRLALLF